LLDLSIPDGSITIKLKKLSTTHQSSQIQRIATLHYLVKKMEGLESKN